MHKNPFVPTPSYPQPPLPPGPPPQQQPDYSAYWAATAQQPNQWTAPQPTPQPPRPPPEQSALYANYGYGGHQNHWQQQQRQQQQQQQQQHQQIYQPPPPIVQPPPQPSQQPYNPYQPQYQPQPYIPQATPQPQPPPVYQHQPLPLQPQPTQHYFPQQPRPQNQNQNRQQHGPPQHFPPPAKRQRFDPPRNQQQQNFQPPPQFQPAPVMPPPMQQQPQYGPVQPQNQPNTRGGPPGVNQVPLGGRGGRGGGRGGKQQGSANMNRGGGSNGRGGRGGMYVNNNRGGGNAGQNGGSFRNHARGGFGNRDHGNRRGGSFNAGAYQQGVSFRGRHNRSGKNEGSGGAARDSGPSSSKKEDPKRVITDFKIVGVEIPELRWSWGVLSRSSKAEPQEGLLDEQPAKMEADDSVPAVENNAPSVADTDMAAKVDAGDGVAPIPLKSEVTEFLPEAMTSAVAVPSLFQIHFETSGTAAVASHAALHADSSSSSRKGKRKRADVEEDDAVHPVDSGADGDSTSFAGVADTDGLGRGSVAPSVTETASEGGDWLMAAIGEDEGDGEASNADEADHHEMKDDQQHQHEDAIDAGPSDAALVHALPLEENAAQPGADTVNGSNGPSSATLSVSSLPITDVAGPGGSGIADSEAVPSEHGNPHSMPTVTRSTAIDLGFPVLSKERLADQPVPPTRQVFPEGFVRAPLQAASSFASTVPDSEYPDTSFSEYSTLVNEDTLNFIDVSTQLTNVEDSQDSPATNIENHRSANRLVICYASANRRVVINAEIVDSLKVFRKEHRIEVSLTFETDDDGQPKGIVVEAMSNPKTYVPLQLSSGISDSDSLVPPFTKALSPSKLVLLVHLNAENPIPEEKWVKSGDLQEWLRTMFGPLFWTTSDSDGWGKKIEVVDPEPAPTIWSVLDGWATNGNVGAQNERQRFVRTHLTETDNILEILLRLVRGERATPFSQSTSTVAATQNSVPGPLLSAIEGSSHGSQQTHVSLAVLALFRIAVDFAKKAEGDKGKAEVEERMGDIVRCLPNHLLHKSLDGMFKEWKVEKKGGR